MHLLHFLSTQILCLFLAKMFLFHQSLFSYRAKVVYQLLDIWKFTDSQFRETLSKIRFRSSYYNNNKKNSSNTHYDQAPPFTACHYLSPDGHQTDQCGDLEKHSSMVVRARNFRYHQSRFDGVWLVSFLLWDWAQPGWNFHRQYR